MTADIMPESNQKPVKKPRFFYGYIIVAAVSVIQLFMLGPRMSFGVFFKPMLNDFNWSRALISGAVSVSSISQGAFGIVMGGLNDRFGPRVVLTICGLSVGIGYLLMSRINEAWQLYLFYALIIGIGMGGILAPTMSTVARWFIKKRSIMTGIVIAGGGTGSIIMPPITTWLISAYGWRTAYLILGAFILVILVLSAQFLRLEPARMGLKPYGKTESEEQRYDQNLQGFSLTGATHTGQFWMLLATLFCYGYLTSTIITHIIPHITDIGISPTVAANIMAVMGVASLSGGLILGFVADRIGNRNAYIGCVVLLSGAIFWRLLADETWMLYVFAIASGFGGGGATMLMSPLSADLFGIRSHGLIFGVCLFSQTIAGALGAFMAGYIFDITGSYSLAFVICGILSIIGLIMMSLLRKTKTGEDTM